MCEPTESAKPSPQPDALHHITTHINTMIYSVRCCFAIEHPWPEGWWRDGCAERRNSSTKGKVILGECSGAPRIYPGRSRDRRPGKTGVRKDYMAHIRDELPAAPRTAGRNHDTVPCLRPVRHLRGVVAPGFLSRRARGLFDLRCLRPARYSAGGCPPRVFRRAGARALPFEKPQQKGTQDETGCQRFHRGEVARGVP